MPDYKESQISGTSWQRCRAIRINNPYGAMPSIAFDEERRFAIGDRTIGETTGGIIKDFDNPAQTFPLFNPATGEPTGQTMTYGEVYAVLWSLYMGLAAERDAEAVTVGVQ